MKTSGNLSFHWKVVTSFKLVSTRKLMQSLVLLLRHVNISNVGACVKCNRLKLKSACGVCAQKVLKKDSKNGCSPYSAKWLLKLKINWRESALFSIVFYLDKFNVIFVQGFVGYKKVGDCDREPKKFWGNIYIKYSYISSLYPLLA